MLRGGDASQGEGESIYSPLCISVTNIFVAMMRRRGYITKSIDIAGIWRPVDTTVFGVLVEAEAQSWMDRPANSATRGSRVVKVPADGLHETTAQRHLDLGRPEMA